MVTANRRSLVKRAIYCFKQQTYPNKELIIVDDGDDDLSDMLTNDLNGYSYHYDYLKKESSFTLGYLRNRTLDLANGEIVTQWDDDDWYSNERVQLQFECLEQGFDAVVLSGTLMHLDDEQFMLSPYIGYLKDGVPGTIMHLRNSSIRYPEWPKAEDTHYLNQWKKLRFTKLADHHYYHFIRCFHGSNTWGKEHFLRRIENNPIDWLLSKYYTHFKKDIRLHPRFELKEEAKVEFMRYLEFSKKIGLL